MRSDHGSDDPYTAQRIREGDVAAFDAFVTRVRGGLVRYITSLVGSTDDARDIAQEALIRLWQHHNRLEPTGSIRSYLYQTARNLAINDIRSRALHSRLEQREALDRNCTEAPRDLESAELRAAVRRAIDSLPARRREAFLLAHIENMTHREVAEIMDISPQTVANQISAALSHLRTLLAPYLATEAGSESLLRSG